MDFVGTLPGQGCGFTYDGENEGHGGFLATNIARQNQLVGWLSQTKPDVVMVHLGTNDVWSNQSPSAILGAFDTLVKQMRASKATMKILVSFSLVLKRWKAVLQFAVYAHHNKHIQIAQIIPMKPSNCADCGQRVVNLNKAIADWAPKATTTESPITVVNCWTGFDTASMTGDGVHPNAKGNDAMVKCWYDPLARVIMDSA
jgi:lysophospholipase L1-like esterase